VTYEEFVRRDGVGLRAGLVAAYGSEVGADAAAEALAYGFEHWGRVGGMDNAAGYLYRVGQSEARRHFRPTGYLPAAPAPDLPDFEPGLAPALEAFGATLETHTAEPIRASDHGRVGPDRSRNRAWAMAGAAACLLAVVVGLVALTGRDAEAPAVQPPAPASTSTSVPMLAFDAEALRTAPIAGLATGCDPGDVVVSADFAAAGTSADDAFATAYAAIIEHTPPGLDALPAEGWMTVAGEPITVRYLDRGSGVEGIVRIRHDGDEWRVTELAQCVAGRVPSAIQTTTIPVTIPELPLDPVPDDPLALERDGWTLLQRTTEPFTAGEIPCEAAQDLAEFDGLAGVHDILTPPDGNGLDLDVQVVDVGSIERGNRLAEVLTMIGRCGAETQGVEGEAGALSSIRATWFRVGPDFALVTIVGEGPRSVVLEIEGAPFGDDLIGELAHRADEFLRGVPVVNPISNDGITVTDGTSLGSPPVEPVPGQVKLWVGNQSFEDDPVDIAVAVDGVPVVDDSFGVGGQHNWFSFMIDGLEPGDHTLTATSDTGAVFEQSFTLAPGEPRWMVVDYWYYPDDAEGRRFTFNESDEPISFD
jgi:hypothetical protein